MVNAAATFPIRAESGGRTGKTLPRAKMSRAPGKNGKVLTAF
jgi:hypothetical protein